MKLTSLFLLTLIFTSCGAMSTRKALEQLQNMPAADYSYIIDPEFKMSKEASEEKLMELYNADELKIGASGTHSYDRETKAQTEERFWLKTVVLNSNRVTDLMDEEATKQFAKEYAGQVLEEVVNIDTYDKVEVVFMQQWNDGQVKTMKRNFFFTVPALEETEW